jgi:hypothetical protein
LKERLARKGIILSIILLFVAASILPDASSTQNCSKEIYVENPSAGVISASLSTFNLTFFGNATLAPTIKLGKQIIWLFAISADTSISPIANIKWIDSLGLNHSIDINTMCWFLGFYIKDFNTNMQQWQQVKGGYVSGWAFYFRLYNQ